MMQAGVKRRPISGQDAIRDIAISDVMQRNVAIHDPGDWKKTEAKTEQVYGNDS